MTSLGVLFLITGCTKLDQNLNSTLTRSQATSALGANGTQLLLETAYGDLQSTYSDPGNVFSLEEVAADECVVPTRLGDWDDNGKWRALKFHTWTSDGVDVIRNQFNSLNKLNFDATNVLSFSPTKQQAAEAKFLRAIALYQLLDLYGKFPLRNPGDNLLNAPPVDSGATAINLIIDDLNAALPDLPAVPASKAQAGQDAAKFLLMRCYLNKGAFINRTSPTFDDADMQQVITLGTQLMGAGYSYSSNFFDNFNASNSTASESIFALPNVAGKIGNPQSNIQNRWWAPLHYNHYTPLNPQAGWNGFSTVAEFYNSFSLTGTTTQTPADTLLDKRLGGRYYPGATDKSGVRPGLLIGQQYNETGAKINDRKGNLLILDPNIDASLKETGNTLEDKGIRIVKYVPDYSQGVSTYSAPGNWLVMFRYPDVVLMVAEAKMRAASPDNSGALTLVNNLRAARGAPALGSMTLVNSSNVYDPTTLLAERGRELYWECVRRTDLVRFGVYLVSWAYKPTDDAHYIVFPLPSDAVAANPNLKQNAGY
ncbi:MAG: RagB/SusD family nutrient uptake outer membrane protein [Bacteroidetes bacterium]|nr:RagB/SusD family nutrient uptake outer membrane protein [Bacteroidota bacterium]